MIRRVQTLLLFLLAFAALTGACGQTTTGGDEGSETHWLSKCTATSDCALGQCLCGVCTVACSTVRDCPAPLDVCLAKQTGGPTCKQSICQPSPSGQSEQALAEARGPLYAITNTCEKGRGGSFVRIAGHDWGVPEDTASFAERAVADGNSGFLLFAGSTIGVVRLSSEGDFVRRLPVPSARNPTLDDVVPLDDGSVLLSGRVESAEGPHAWMGKVDANWKLLWELELELTLMAHTDLEGLPDGGGILAGVSGRDANGPEDASADDIFWARISGEGELLWERRASFAGVTSGGPGSLRMLALTDQGARLVVGSSEGIFLITSDLDGNSEEQVLQSYPGSPVIDVQALPDGRLVILSLHGPMLFDQAGQMLWETFINNERPGNVARAFNYDLARDELIVVGDRLPASGGSGSWLYARKVDGEATWELNREPVDLDTVVMPEGAGAQGPPLSSVAVDAAGNIVAPGYAGRGFEYLWLGAGACGG